MFVTFNAPLCTFEFLTRERDRERKKILNYHNIKKCQPTHISPIYPNIIIWQPFSLSLRRCCWCQNYYCMFWRCLFCFLCKIMPRDPGTHTRREFGKKMASDHLKSHKIVFCTYTKTVTIEHWTKKIIAYEKKFLEFILKLFTSIISTRKWFIISIWICTHYTHTVRACCFIYISIDTTHAKLQLMQ